MTDPISEDAEYVLIVRQGWDELFLSLKERMEPPGQVRVIWDRRGGERRQAGMPRQGDRRAGERRQTNLLGNVLAIMVAAPPGRPPSASRPAA